MKGYAYLWFSAVVVPLLVSSGVAAGGGAELAFSPNDTTVPVGTTFFVEVTVSGVNPDPGLAAYDLLLTFNPTVLRLDSLSDSGFATGSENLVICVTGRIDNIGGAVNATCTAVPLFGAPGVSTKRPVALLHASFTALAAGSSHLTLSGSLSGPEGEEIAATFQDGIVDVSGPVPSPNAQTPIPNAGSPALPTAGTGADDGRDLGPVLAGAAAIAAAGITAAGTVLLILRQRRHRA